MGGLIRVRHPDSHRRGFRTVGRFAFPLAVGALLVAGSLLAAAIAHAQTNLKFPERPKVPNPPAVSKTDKAPMLVQANQINYDYSNERVSADGSVQIYYNGSTLEADKVIYDQKTKRLHAEGNARLTEPDGKVTFGETMDLSDDYRDGFVDSLRLDAPDETRFAATRADRSNGNITVFQNGVYTACLPCKDDPKKPPTWQVKAARIIHDQNEKTIYFEDARIEFFGVPTFYFPYFSSPDPTVKRKTGFLFPTFSSATNYGYAASIPFYWALAPNYDLTLTPTITTRQGPLLQAEFRQRFENGSYSVHIAGIEQLDKDYYLRPGGPATAGFRDFRGTIDTAGQFAINDKWLWGYTGVLPTDKAFYQDYGIRSYQSNLDPFRSNVATGISQIYLSGKGNRSYFDIRSIYYYGLSEADQQSKIPVIHPVLDYDYTVDHPVLGGELSYKFNLTSLSRSNADFNAINDNSLNGGLCPMGADPAQPLARRCLLRGIPGEYTRFSAKTEWRRSFTDSFGQVFTPFASLRADAASVSIKSEPGVSNFIETGDNNIVRAMPTVGLEYHYPFVDVQSWGTQTIEPIAQVIVRPNETNIRKFPNEDSQSFIFDDSNLFKVDKFAGWDREEGGSRANVGVQYTAQFNQAGRVNALFGQSYSLFGQNSFAAADIANAGLDSGLETDRSDYVARLAYEPNRIFSFTTRYRFDHDTFEVRRFEAEGKANLDRWNVSLLYGNYDAQPDIGFLTRRQGILGTAAYKVTQNIVVSGGARYNFEAGQFDQTQIGVGYVDDCLILALNYLTNFTFSNNVQRDQRVMLSFSLRTLGGTSFSQAVGTTVQ